MTIEHISPNDTTINHYEPSASIPDDQSTIDHGGVTTYESIRQPLWDIHEFVREVLAKDSKGFLVTPQRNGSKSIEALALGRKYYRLINNYLGRIPMPCTAPGLIGLFIDCCIEFQLFLDPFGKPSDHHRHGMNGAELFNELLDLIRTRAKKDKRCKKFLNIAADYDLVQMKSVEKYVSDLFRSYSKILVVRVDLGYAADEADKVTFERAKRDIGHFVNRHHCYPGFSNWIGFVIRRERGIEANTRHDGIGRGFHFHCFVFFDGQKERDDRRLAHELTDYWADRIINRRNTRENQRIKPWAHRCNDRKDQYQYCGIGMISHSDEVKRTNLLYAILYITKNSQLLGDEAPPHSRSISKGEIDAKISERRGRRRQLLIGGKMVKLPRETLNSGLREVPPLCLTPELNTEKLIPRQYEPSGDSEDITVARSEK